MDTIFARKISFFNLKSHFYAAGFFFLAFVLYNLYFMPSIFANDLIANTNLTVPAMTTLTKYINNGLSSGYLKNKFDARIKEKYQGYYVSDVADGVKHIRMTRYFSGKPVRLNVVEVNKLVAKDYEVRPAVASSSYLHSKRTVRTIAQNTNSIVAINGGFFKPQTGVPLGTLMINHKLYTGPIYDRVAFGIFENGYKVDRVQFKGKIIGNGYEIPIDNINQPRMLSSYILMYTRDWGAVAPASPQYGVQLRVENNRITAASANPLSIPQNGYVLVGPKSKLSKLFGAGAVDTQLLLSSGWNNAKHIIGGGPYLVKNGEVYVDMTAEKLQAIGGRNPRTAIGYTKDNDLILITADGREGHSVGLTLVELANFMKSLGCVDAINLDGGGSTVMYVNGGIVNKPQQIGGIALSNAMVISKKSDN